MLYAKAPAEFQQRARQRRPHRSVNALPERTGLCLPRPHCDLPLRHVDNSISHGFHRSVIVMDHTRPECALDHIGRYSAIFGPIENQNSPPWCGSGIEIRRGGVVVRRLVRWRGWGSMRLGWSCDAAAYERWGYGCAGMRI